MRKVSAELNSFLISYGPEVSKLHLATRRIVLKEAPKSNELIYDAYNAVSCAYSFTKNLKDAFIHIAAYPKYVNLGFNCGASLSDPKNMLQGSGKKIRHISITKEAELDNEDIIQLIKKAIAQGESIAGSVPDKGISLVKSISERKRRPL